MNRSPKKAGRARKVLAGLLIVAVGLGVSGCQTLTFYGQAIHGEFSLLAHQQRVEQLLAAPQTPKELKQQLQLLQNLLAFAERDLKLPVDKQYRKYVDVHRPFVVWNVEAAPEFSLEPKSWWYPLVGSLDYRGYFSESGARACARRLREKGYDVHVGGVQAYSTLGWFKDPALNTFIFEPEAELAETIFHELGHQRVFAHGDTDFNEAFATAVGQEGARRWLLAEGDTATTEAYLAHLRRNDQFVRLIQTTRQRLATLYGDEQTEEGKLKASQKKSAVLLEPLRLEKQRALVRLQEEYAQLKAQWGGNTEYDAWFAGPVNNAQLNSVAAYYDLVPGFDHLLELNGGDLQKFYEAADLLAAKPKKERREGLRTF
jgi:predicted aminopeptidase